MEMDLFPVGAIICALLTKLSSFLFTNKENNQSTNLHYRGARVWQAVIEDLLAKGMNKAENL